MNEAVINLVILGLLFLLFILLVIVLTLLIIKKIKMNEDDLKHDEDVFIRDNLATYQEYEDEAKKRKKSYVKK